MTSIIRVAIAGYGNLGRGAQAAIKQSPDMQLVCVFSRRDPASVTLIDDSVPVYAMDDIAQYKDEFITGLKQLTEEIFDSSKPFLPTDDKSRCETCIYKSICG